MNVANEKHVRALIEEQLGELRQFAALPSTDIEAVAMRIASAIGSCIQDRCTSCGEIRRDAA